MRRAWRQRITVFRFPARGTLSACRLSAWLLPLGGRTLGMLTLGMLTLGMLTLGMLTLLAGGGLPSPARAETQPVLRVSAGDHPYFGRVVLNAAGLSYAV